MTLKGVSFGFGSAARSKAKDKRAQRPGSGSEVRVKPSRGNISKIRFRLIRTGLGGRSRDLMP